MDFLSEAPPSEGEMGEDRRSVEVEELSRLVQSVESLAWLKPRLASLREHPPSSSDLVGLYRIVSSTLLDHMLVQASRTRDLVNDYEKRLRQQQEGILFQAGTEFVKSLRGERASPPPPPPQRPPEEIGQVAALRKQLEIKDEILLEGQERYDKMVADVRNIRARAKTDLDLQLQRVKESLFRKLLPVLDSLDQALGTVAGSRDLESIMQGVEQIHHQLLDACASEGVKPVRAVGEAFDPRWHEAMGHVDTDEVPEDRVFDEVRRGYTLDEKLLRAAMVRLSRAPKSAGPSVRSEATGPSVPEVEERPLPALPSDHPGPAPAPGSVEPPATAGEGAEPGAPVPAVEPLSPEDAGEAVGLEAAGEDPPEEAGELEAAVEPPPGEAVGLEAAGEPPPGEAVGLEAAGEDPPEEAGEPEAAVEACLEDAGRERPPRPGGAGASEADQEGS